MNPQRPHLMILPSAAAAANAEGANADDTIGDFGCEGVEVDAWRKANRVPMFPQQINRWAVRRRLQEGETPDTQTVRVDLVRRIEQFLGRAAKNVNVDGNVSAAPLDLSEAVQTYRQLPMPLLTQPDPAMYLYILLRFEWHSATENAPWFVRNDSSGLQFHSARHCPVDPTWFLEAVLPPAGAVEERTENDKPVVDIPFFGPGDEQSGESGGIASGIAAGITGSRALKLPLLLGAAGLTAAAGYLAWSSWQARQRQEAYRTVLHKALLRTQQALDTRRPSRPSSRRVT